MGETKTPIVNHTNAEPPFTTAGGHGNFSGFYIQLMSVRLETDEVPLLHTAAAANLGDGLGTVQKTINGSIWQHIIPPTLR